ncbi:acylneuraminate cytidylyltransferase family protein [bacterium]|nr:acylneuraminate cytidylyltransferase family protein [bacterium]
MKTIAIITARGGSKRIHKKNIVPVGQQPLLAWSVDAALSSGVCDRVLVSTDDASIGEIAREAGADVPFLRENASDDEATASEACLAALAQAEAHWGEKYDNVILMMPTCPLRTGEQVANQFKRFSDERLPFLLSCADFGPMKPWWAFTMDTQGAGDYLHPDALKTRSQLLDKLYAPSGATWIARVDDLRHAGSFYGPEHRFHPISWISAIDIDEPADIELVELLFSDPATMKRIGLKNLQ